MKTFFEYEGEDREDLVIHQFECNGYNVRMEVKPAYKERVQKAKERRNEIRQQLKEMLNNG